MNIGGLYNASSLFQNMYNTNSYGSSSMASLTSNILGGSSSGMYSSLSDYSLIKSGSYNKLMSAYYDTVGSDEDTSKSSADILEKLKASRTPAKEETDKVVAETEDGKVVEKTETATADKKAESDTNDTAKKTDVLSDLMRRNRTISYTNMGGVIKNMATPSFDYIV